MKRWMFLVVMALAAIWTFGAADAEAHRRCSVRKVAGKAVRVATVPVRIVNHRRDHRKARVEARRGSRGCKASTKAPTQK